VPAPGDRPAREYPAPLAKSQVATESVALGCGLAKNSILDSCTWMFCTQHAVWCLLCLDLATNHDCYCCESPSTEGPNQRRDPLPVDGTVHCTRSLLEQDSHSQTCLGARSTSNQSTAFACTLRIQKEIDGSFPDRRVHRRNSFAKKRS
jgi:hypothetical protein